MREGEIFNPAGGRRQAVEREYLSPTKQCQGWAADPPPVKAAAGTWHPPLSSFPVLWKAVGSGVAALRAGSVWSEARRRDFKLSGTFAKLHKPRSARPPLRYLFT